MQVCKKYRKMSYTQKKKAPAVPLLREPFFILLFFYS